MFFNESGDYNKAGTGGRPHLRGGNANGTMRPFLGEPGVGRASGFVLQCTYVFLVACGCAAPVSAQPVSVKDAWVRVPAPGQNIAGAYMEITGGTHHWLISAASPVAARAELHAMTLDGGVMKMRQVEKIGLPGGKPVKLAPGGLHIMLTGLKRTLKLGDKVPLTLTVLRDGPVNRAVITVQAEVRAGPAAPAHQH
jgi:hypothetical protein